MKTLKSIKDILSKQSKLTLAEHIILGFFIVNFLRRIRKENGGYKKFFGSFIYKLL
jgi:hypothetical protein